MYKGGQTSVDSCQSAVFSKTSFAGLQFTAKKQGSGYREQGQKQRGKEKGSIGHRAERKAGQLSFAGLQFTANNREPGKGFRENKITNEKYC